MNEVYQKMEFFSVDRNLKLLAFAIFQFSKNKENALIENEIVLEQLSVISKLLKIEDKNLIEQAVEMFHCISPITGLSLNDYYLSIKDLLDKTPKEIIDKQIKLFDN